MSTAAKARRTVRYASLDEFREDAEELAAGDYETIGNWTYPQILDHLTHAMNCSFDGFPFRAPWWLRTFVAPLLKNRFLYKPMPAGFKLRGKSLAMLPRTEELPLHEALDNLRLTLSRFDSESPDALHPGFGRMTREEYILLHLRHAELHMSFVRPR